MTKPSPQQRDEESGSKHPDRPRDVVGAVVHVMKVLKSFDAEHAQMTLTEVARRADLNRAGARRYLLTLAHLGYVVHDGKQFRLSPKVLELGYSYMAAMPLSGIAQGFLDRITAQTGETAAMAILDGDEIVHLARASTNRVFAPTVTVGRPFKALYTSTGRVLLAFHDRQVVDEYKSRVRFDRPTPWSISSMEQLEAELKKIRRQGYAIADQEIEEGVRSIAVPILNGNGRPIAAVNVVTNIATVAKKRLTDEFLPILKAVAAEMQETLSRR